MTHRKLARVASLAAATLSGSCCPPSSPQPNLEVDAYFYGPPPDASSSNDVTAWDCRFVCCRVSERLLEEGLRPTCLDLPRCVLSEAPDVDEESETIWLLSSSPRSVIGRVRCEMPVSEDNCPY